MPGAISVTPRRIQMSAISGRRASFVGFLALALALGYVPFLSVPLGWYETLFHEMSHGIAAVLTGGGMTRLVLRGDGSGTMWTSGGVRPIVLFCGYLGAVAWGGAIYASASRLSQRGASRLCLALAALAVIDVLLLARDPVTVAILAVLAVPPAVLSRPSAARAARGFLRLVGASCLVSGMRAPTYVLAAGVGDNDAQFLKDITFIPVHAWVGAWLACGVLSCVLVWRAEGLAARSGTRGLRDSARRLPGGRGALSLSPPRRRPLHQ
jgi:hypothetical protein